MKRDIDKYILETKGLSVDFKTSAGILNAVDNVSLQINHGRTLGIVGESGCGKSTTGRAILKLIEPTRGHVIFEGQDITKFNRNKMRKLRTEMTMIFQDPFSSLNPKNTISQLINTPIIEHNLIKGKEQIEKRTLELMDTVGLARRYMNTYPHELDGGRRQRIGIARALSVNPKLIICDEPVSALDVSIQAQILNLLKTLQKDNDLTYIFITHDLSVVRYFSDEIAVMYLGQIVEKATVEELFKNPLHPYTQALLSAIPEPFVKEHRGSKKLIKGEISSPINMPNRCRFLKRCEYADLLCNSKTCPRLNKVCDNHWVACHHINTV